MAQLMPLPLTVSCFSKIQIGFTFLVPAHLGTPGQWAVKWVCVCARGNQQCTHSLLLFYPAIPNSGLWSWPSNITSTWSRYQYPKYQGQRYFFFKLSLWTTKGVSNYSNSASLFKTWRTSAEKNCNIVIIIAISRHLQLVVPYYGQLSANIQDNLQQLRTAEFYWSCLHALAESNECIPIREERLVVSSIYIHHPRYNFAVISVTQEQYTLCKRRWSLRPWGTGSQTWWRTTAHCDTAWSHCIVAVLGMVLESVYEAVWFDCCHLL